MVKCSKKLVTKKTWGKVRDAFKTKNVTKLWKKSKMGRGGGAGAKNQKVHNSKCRLFFDEGGGSELFQFFPN